MTHLNDKEVGARIGLLQQHLKLNNRQFALRATIDVSYMKKVVDAEKSLSEGALKKISEKYNANPEWILFGKGNMFGEKEPKGNDSSLKSETVAEENTSTYERKNSSPSDESRRTLERTLENLSQDKIRSTALIEKMTITNERNSRLMAAMFAELFPNSPLASQLKVSPDGQHTDDDLPIEAFLGNAGINGKPDA